MVAVAADANAEPVAELCVTLTGTIFTAGPMVDAAILVERAEINSRDIRMQPPSIIRWAVALRIILLAI